MLHFMHCFMCAAAGDTLIFLTGQAEIDNAVATCAPQCCISCIALCALLQATSSSSNGGQAEIDKVMHPVHRKRSVAFYVPRAMCYVMYL
jgi:hypothetical protein